MTPNTQIFSHLLSALQKRRRLMHQIGMPSTCMTAIFQIVLLQPSSPRGYAPFPLESGGKGLTLKLRTFPPVI